MPNKPSFFDRPAAPDQATRRASRPERVRIVTDTTAVLPQGYAVRHHVEVVPQIVLFGEENFEENINLTYAEFITRLKASPQLPKTAAPPPAMLVEAYRRQLTKATSIVSIHPSIDVSGTVRSARVAVQDAFPDADIRILDTRTVAGNLTTLVQLAVTWAEAGQSADDIVAGLQALIPRSRTYFLVATLDYLYKGGRIGGAAALVGSMLQIKPILEIKNGRVEALERVRTHDHALDRLKILVSEQCPHSLEAYPCVMHADKPAQALSLADELEKTLRVDRIPIYNLGASITTHAGPGTLAVGFFV